MGVCHAGSCSPIYSGARSIQEGQHSEEVGSPYPHQCQAPVSGCFTSDSEERGQWRRSDELKTLGLNPVWLWILQIGSVWTFQTDTWASGPVSIRSYTVSEEARCLSTSSRSETFAAYRREDSTGMGFSCPLDSSCHWLSLPWSMLLLSLIVQNQKVSFSQGWQGWTEEYTVLRLRDICIQFKWWVLWYSRKESLCSNCSLSLWKNFVRSAVLSSAMMLGIVAQSCYPKRNFEDYVNSFLT